MCTGSFASPRQTVPDKDGSKRRALRLPLAAGKGERNMSDNWVVQNLENALATWNEKLAEIWQLITQVAGAVQRRHHLERGPAHPRHDAGHWPCAVGAVFCGGGRENLRLLRRDQAPGGGGKALYPLCAGQSRRDLRTGTDDGPVHHCAGRHFLHHVGGRQWVQRRRRYFPAEIVSRRWKAAAFGEHPPLGGGADRWSFYHDFVFCYGPHGIWPLFSPVYLHGHCSDPPFDLCRGTQPANRQELFEILRRRVSGGSHYRTGLHHLLPVCIQPARR